MRNISGMILSSIARTCPSARVVSNWAVKKTGTFFVSGVSLENTADQNVFQVWTAIKPCFLSFKHMTANYGSRHACPETLGDDGFRWNFNVSKQEKSFELESIFKSLPDTFEGSEFLDRYNLARAGLTSDIRRLVDSMFCYLCDQQWESFENALQSTLDFEVTYNWQDEIKKNAEALAVEVKALGYKTVREQTLVNAQRMQASFLSGHQRAKAVSDQCSS